MEKINLNGFTNLQECLEKALPPVEGEVRKYKDGDYKFINGKWKKNKGDIVKYDGDRYIILDIIDDELWIRPLRNPYGGSYHTSPMSYPNLKVKIDNPKLEFFS